MPKYKVTQTIEGILWNGNNFNDVIVYFDKTYPTIQGHSNWYEIIGKSYVWGFVTDPVFVPTYNAKLYAPDTLFLIGYDVSSSIDLVIPKNTIITLTKNKHFRTFIGCGSVVDCS
jgi:hypothetical protein